MSHARHDAGMILSTSTGKAPEIQHTQQSSRSQELSTYYRLRLGRSPFMQYALMQAKPALVKCVATSGGESTTGLCVAAGSSGGDALAEHECVCSYCPC